MGSESDIELVAVSCKFDFSERRNLPNMGMDPDHKLLEGFRGLPPVLPVHLFPLLTLCWKYIKAPAFLSSSILPAPPLPVPVPSSPPRHLSSCLLTLSLTSNA